MPQASSQTLSDQQQPFTQKYSSPSSPRLYRGVKRPAPDSLQDPEHQRLAKRFEILNLENANKLYIPVASSDSSGAAGNSSAPPGRKLEPAIEFMSVDSTPDRVYIADLDAELADSSPSPSLCAYATGADDDVKGPVFLPDIERHLSKIPAHVLRPPTAEEAARGDIEGEDLVPTKENQVVLYGGPKDDDEAAESVRRAMICAAMSERQARRRKSSLGGEAREPESVSVCVVQPLWGNWVNQSPQTSPRTRPVSLDHEVDPMDMDID